MDASGSTTQSGSLLGVNGFDDLLIFGIEVLLGGRTLDCAGRPVALGQRISCVWPI